VPPGVPPFIERDAELKALMGPLAEPPSLAVVAGEPGIGKTRLIREALSADAVAGRQVLIGRSRRTGRTYPLGPVLEALADAEFPRRLSPLSGVLRAVLPERAAQLPPVPPPLTDPALVRHRLVRATAQLLAELGPTILVLEDLHWADEETLELLELVGTRPPPELSLAVTFRTWPADDRLRLQGLLSGPLGSLVRARIELGPLTVPGVAALAAHLLTGHSLARHAPGDVPGDTAELLHRRSGGIPSPLREDVLLLQKRGMLRVAGGRWRLANDSVTAAGPGLVPRLENTVADAVRADILTRTRELSPSARLVLDAAAVLSQPANPDVLSDVSGLRPNQTTEAIAENERTGLLVELPGACPGLGFRYGLARHTIYQAMPVARRRRLHTRAAKVLASNGEPDLVEEVVHHHRRAGNPRTWARSAEGAADIAADRGDLATAATFGWAALGHPDAENVAILTTALRQPHCARTQRVEIRLLRALIQLDAMDADTEPDTVAADLRQAVGDLGTRAGLRAIGLAALAQPGRLPAIGLSERVAYLAEARTLLDLTRDPVAHAAVLTTTLSLSAWSAVPDSWQALEALPALGTHIHVDREVVHGLRSIAEAALGLGHYPHAAQVAERALDLATRRGLTGYLSSLRTLRTRAHWLMGEACTESDTHRPALAGPVSLRLHSGLLTGQILVGRGRMEAGRNVLRTVVNDACRTGDLAVAASAAAELNRSVLSPTDRQDADTAAGRVLDRVADRPGWLLAAPLLPFANLGLVRPVMAAYRDGIAGRDAPLARAALTFAEARLAEHDGDTIGARARYTAARRQYAELPDPRMAAHTAASEADCVLAGGLPVEPQPLLHAWRTFHDLGASWDADRLKAQIRRAGLPAPHRRGRPGYGTRLSPREREIAGLASTGQTNNDIAVRLYLSERTVKYHLANAMRKLGVTGRRQLADALSRREEASQSQSEEPRDHTCRCFRCGRQLNLALTDG
jgi:DNA-binding CsgD family transcriptional regulator